MKRIFIAVLAAGLIAGCGSGGARTADNHYIDTNSRVFSPYSAYIPGFHSGMPLPYFNYSTMKPR